MNSAAQPSILVDDSDVYYYPLLAYARVGEESGMLTAGPERNKVRDALTVNKHRQNPHSPGNTLTPDADSLDCALPSIFFALILLCFATSRTAVRQPD